jgi:hypothetical protein
MHDTISRKGLPFYCNNGSFHWAARAVLLHFISISSRQRSPDASSCGAEHSIQSCLASPTSVIIRAFGLSPPRLSALCYPPSPSSSDHFGRGSEVASLFGAVEIPLDIVLVRSHVVNSANFWTGLPRFMRPDYNQFAQGAGAAVLTPARVFFAWRRTCDNHS